MAEHGFEISDFDYKLCGKCGSWLHLWPGKMKLLFVITRAFFDV